MSKSQLFFEDFAPQRKFEGAERTILQSDVHGFAALTGDAHPIHYDAEYARQTPFGRPVVHGLHLMGLTALGATPLSDRVRDSMVALVEQGSTFKKPVFIGDTVQSVFEVAETQAIEGRDFGFVRFTVRLMKEGEVALEAFHRYRIRRRPAVQN